MQLDEAFKSAAGFLQRVEANKGRVLIHCVAGMWSPIALDLAAMFTTYLFHEGVSRSVSIFLMYIMAFHHIKLSALWNHVRTVRYYFVCLS